MELKKRAAAFCFGPVWFAGRGHITAAVLWALAWLAYDAWVTPSPLRFTIPLETMLAAGLLAPRLSPAAPARPWRWQPAAWLAAGSLVLSLGGPLLLGVRFWDFRRPALAIGSLAADLMHPDARFRDLVGVRREYQQAFLNGDFAAGLRLNEAALKLSRWQWGRQHILSFAIASDLIGEHQHLGHYDRVDAMVQEARRDVFETYGQETILEAFLMNQQVGNELARGRVQPARPLCFNALLILEKVPRQDIHPYILLNAAYVYANLGRLQMMDGEFEPAERNFREALAMADQAGRGWPPATCYFLERLGECYLAQQQLDEAVAVLAKAKAAAESALGPDTPLAASACRWLGEARLRQGRPAEARGLADRAYRLNLRHYGPNHLVTAESRHALGRVWLADRRGSEAARHLKAALDAVDQAIGKENAVYAGYLPAMAEAYGYQGEIGLAERCLQMSRQIMAQVYGAGHPRMLEPMAALLDLYQQTGNLRAEKELKGDLLDMRKGE